MIAVDWSKNSAWKFKNVLSASLIKYFSHFFTRINSTRGHLEVGGWGGISINDIKCNYARQPQKILYGRLSLVSNVLTNTFVECGGKWFSAWRFIYTILGRLLDYSSTNKTIGWKSCISDRNSNNKWHKLQFLKHCYFRHSRKRRFRIFAIK